jgi:hypothetical protein
MIRSGRGWEKTNGIRQIVNKYIVAEWQLRYHCHLRRLYPWEVEISEIESDRDELGAVGLALGKHSGDFPYKYFGDDIRRKLIFKVFTSSWFL